MVIAKAIQKYGVENFSFEVLLRNLSIEQAKEEEKNLISEKNTLVPHGYNVSPGGDYNICSNDKRGENNPNARLTNQEAQYILDHRNQPMYILYQEFIDKISYQTFKKVYHHITFQNLTTNTEEYKYNFEFSNQFTNNPLEYDEIVDLRKRYLNGEYWRIVYEDYKWAYSNEWSFYNVYHGKTYSLIMPEVFTKELKRLHSSLCKTGERNGRSKITEEDVRQIRRRHLNGEKTSQIHQDYSYLDISSIRRIINRTSWSHVQ